MQLITRILRVKCVGALTMHVDRVLVPIVETLAVMPYAEWLYTVSCRMASLVRNMLEKAGSLVVIGIHTLHVESTLISFTWLDDPIVSNFLY